VMSLCRMSLPPRMVALVVALLVSANLNEAAVEKEDPSGLVSSLPPQAVLVCYSPSVERLAAAWDALAAVRQANYLTLGALGDRLARIDREFLRRWSDQLSLTMNDLAEALPGEILIGWMPQVSDQKAAFDRDDWVLIARRSPDRDHVVRRLWERMVATVAKEKQIRQQLLDGIVVEEIVWEEKVESRLAPKRPRSLDGDAVPPEAARPEAGRFVEVIRVKHRAMSVAIGERYIFFAPARAQALTPWIRALASEQRTIAVEGDRLGEFIQEANATGELVLAVHVKPPAWVPPRKGATEQRLGPNPRYVFLSQVRAVEAALTRRENALLLDMRAKILSPPGWLARLLETFLAGASFSLADDCTVQMVARADFSSLWKTIRSILYEGWPAVALGVDMFFALPGNQTTTTPTDWLGQLPITLGNEARLFVFEETTGSLPTRSWALTFDLRDAERFSVFERRFDRLLERFSIRLARHEVGADGRLQQVEDQRPTTGPAFHSRLYSALWDSRFAVAGSRGALEKVVRTVSARSVVGGRTDRDVSDLFADLWQGQAAILLCGSGDADRHGPIVIGDRVRRIVRGPQGTIELVSPLPDGKTSRPVATARTKPVEVGSAAPAARWVAGLVVQSATEVRLRMLLQGLSQTKTDAAARARTPRPRQPTIQE